MGGCVVCGSDPATPCGGCGKVQYCGKECQKKAWRDHKSKCKNYKATHSAEEHGRHIIANRDIKAGEKIIEMKPLLVGPRVFEPTICCLGCHSAIGKLLECASCKLPVCGTKCAASAQHQMECSLISKHKGNLKEGAPPFGLETVFALRVIALQYTKPEHYREFMTFESNIEEIRKSPKWKSYQAKTVDPILALEIPDINEDLISKIIGVVLTNTFEVVARGCLIVGFFSDPSLMNHHCVGNVRLSMDANQKMTVMAATNIKKNTPIKFNYVKALDTTWIRQLNLKDNKFFTCLCNRCLDPKELGSYLSAHKCTNDNCRGHLLPEEPLSMLKDWKCDTCSSTVEAEQIRKTLKNLQTDANNVDKNSIKDLKKLLNKYSSKLHKNHGVLTELKQFIISGMGRLPGMQVEDLSEADHKYKIQLSLEVLSVLNIVEPGLSLGRGLMMYELHTSLVIVANQEFEKNHSSNQLLVRLLEAEKYLKESGVILKYETASSPYGHLAANISQNMEELGGYIESVKMM